MLTLGDPGYELWHQFADGRACKGDHPVLPRWNRVRGLRSGDYELVERMIDVEPARRTRSSSLFAQAQDLLRVGAEESCRRGCALVFTDCDGILLASYGVDALADPAMRECFQEGVCWTEKERGTNAIG